MKQRSISMGTRARQILLFALALTVMSAPAIAQQLIATIPVATSPGGAAINPATNKIYVASSNDVIIIDGARNSVIQTVNVGEEINFPAVNPATNQIYVANFNSDNVTIIDGTNDSAIKTVTVGTEPSSVAVNPATNKIYVTNFGSNNVSVIDGANNSLIKTVTVGSHPQSVAVNPATNQIYVANSYDKAVSIIDGKTNSVIKTVTVGSFPAFTAVNPATNQIFVANVDGDTVSVIDGTNNSVIKTITVGDEPNWLAINPVTNRIYVSNFQSNNVTVIDGTNDVVIKTVSVGKKPYYLAVNPVTNRVYVPNAGSGNITVIDGASFATKTVAVGNRPYWLTVNPTTNKVYVSNSDDNTVSVIAGADPSPLQLVAVPPCRLVDTRNTHSPIQGGTSTAFNLPQSGGCNIPSTAAAYSLNVTVVPQGPLGYLTMWPTGEDQPLVSTMNSLDGRVKANAAIVPAGYQGAVNVYASNTTDVILDINGYFAPVGKSTLAFYPLTPCRVADTRHPSGQLGGPYLKGKQERDFPLEAAPCNIPSSTQAYSLNFTAIPKSRGLGYLTVWPLGQSQPFVSTLNAPTGVVTANAAIVPAGYIGNVSVYVTDDTDLAIDINGYFAPEGQGGLSLYPSAPCRVLDTRQTGGLFSGTIGSDVVGSVCQPPKAAQAYVFNATVVPQGSLGYLTLWPDKEQQPFVSTLNAGDGAISSNMAIVPTINGAVDAYSSNPTQLILDISSYFAP